MAINKASQIREIKNTKQWAEQIWYWRTHLDVFIEEYFGIKLKDVQKVEARMFGNCDTIYFVQSRGFGKTWLTAVCCLAMGVLYPGSLIAVISGTAEQATLVPKKIDTYFTKYPDIMREIDTNGHAAVQLNRSKGKCKLKNGSEIESYSIGTFRGNRAKIIVIDEAPEVKKDDLEAIAKPVRNTTRETCVQLGIPDYPSKMISITSACLKSNYFYEAFVDTLKRIAKGATNCFACTLDYKAAARVGITPMSFFEEEKRTMPESKFAMEYGSEFLGAEAGSVFPYELTERCRVLKEVETAQPAKSTSEYVMGVDLATSSAKHADNAVIVLIKLIECENGGYIKKVVFIRSFHGKRLDSLATEVRKLLVKFNNVSKIVVDCRGLGDAFPAFLAQPWIDPETNKEYPPLVPDDSPSIIHNAVPLLHPVIANNTLNHQMVSATTVALEQQSVELPVSSRFIIDNHVTVSDDEDGGSQRKLGMTEKAIFVEADALQIEMGNIIGKQSGSGAIIYDVAKATQHKDRYSAQGMALKYISDLEEDRKRRMYQLENNMVPGVVSFF